MFFVFAAFEVALRAATESVARVAVLDPRTTRATYSLLPYARKLAAVKKSAKVLAFGLPY